MFVESTVEENLKEIEGNIRNMDNKLSMFIWVMKL